MRAAKGSGYRRQIQTRLESRNSGRPFPTWIRVARRIEVRSDMFFRLANPCRLCYFGCTLSGR